MLNLNEEPVSIEEVKRIIDNMTYYELLEKWRFAKAGDPLFQGEIGQYYSKVLSKKRDELDPGEAVQISKAIGWGD